MKRDHSKQFILGLILIASSGLAGCGGGNQTGLIGQFFYKQYVDNQNHCVTKPAYYLNSRDEYCQTLSNDRLNLDPSTGQVCALTLRQEQFKADCSGYTWPTTSN